MGGWLTLALGADPADPRQGQQANLLIEELSEDEDNAFAAALES